LGRIEQGDGVSETALQAVLKAGGVGAVSTAIELLGRTGSLKVRKTLSTLLGGLGEPAVPMLLDLMNDSRWFIIRNICSILGSIASHESLPALMKCLQHSDLRVRKEALRSMSLIGGSEAENALLGILRGTDSEMLPQAIVLLGGMKSKKSLIELMKIVLSKEIFLKSLSLKIDALAAIGLIGNRQVTPYLVKLLEPRYLFAAARGRKLKAAVAVCLGKLGDARAVPHLEKLASGNRELAATCAEAIVMIEKRKED
jgi:HEAT repeat protein